MKRRFGAIHERVSIISSCFRGAGLGQVIDACTAIGVGRVSLAATLLEGDAGETRAMLDGAGLALETVVHGLCIGSALDADEAVIAAEQARLIGLIRTAAALGGRSVFVGTGGRGALDWEAAAARFCEAIRPCVAAAQAAGIDLMIENMLPLYAEFGITHSLRDTVALAEMAGTGICLDIFPCWTEAGLAGTIARAMPRVGLVQIADYVLSDRSLPARAVPGDGAIPVRRLVEEMLANGYTGAFDVEMMGPRIDAEGHEAAARRAALVLSGMLNELGA